MTDVPARPTPRVISKSEWTPRREERRKDKVPPSEPEMFRNVDQLRTESHMDTMEANLADALHNSEAKAGRMSARGTNASSVLGDIKATRSQMGKDMAKPPKPGAHRQQHSTNRMETHYGR